MTSSNLKTTRESLFADSAFILNAPQGVCADAVWAIAPKIKRKSIFFIVLKIVIKPEIRTTHKGASTIY